MEKHNVGDMIVIYIRNGVEQRFPVKTVEEARKLIDAMARRDLKDKTVDFNSFSLMVYEPENEYSQIEGEYRGWYEWRDEEDLDINGYWI